MQTASTDAAKLQKVFIDGKEGTTGLRIYERFAQRTDVELLTISEELRKDPAERKRLINSADIVFLCLPDAAARESVAMCENPNTRIIDTSTAHRTAAGWSYGFPELSAAHRDDIAKGKRIAVPGCHACGFISLAYPLVSAGILPVDYPLVCYSVTGYSGGGKSMIAQYESESRPTELDSPRQYGLTQQHKHLPEMRAVCGLEYDPVFAPFVSDFYSGMVVSLPLHSRMLKNQYGVAEIHEIFAKHYEGQKIINVLPLNVGESIGFVGANNLSGKDNLEILVSGNDERILLCARFDNLGKGASGAAIQCLNIALGLDECTGLNI